MMPMKNIFLVKIKKIVINAVVFSCCHFNTNWSDLERGNLSGEIISIGLACEHIYRALFSGRKA